MTNPRPISDAELLRALIRWRGIDTPCERCGGSGWLSYGSTATWHGGIGGQSFTSDVCNLCWGSGDADRPWANLRELMAQRLAWEEDQCLEYLRVRLGTNLQHTDIPARVRDLAALCDKEANRRKLPEGAKPFWWHHTWTALGSILRRLADGGTRAAAIQQSGSTEGGPCNS